MKLKLNKNYWLLLISILAIIAFFSGMHMLELRAEEPRRALVSMEMILTGEYLVPHINGWPYFNKPPLFNWLQIIFIKVIGSYDEWVVRLPGVISFLGMCFLTYKFVKVHLNKQFALIIALMVLTSGDLLFYGTVHAGEIDLFYSLIVSVQLMSIYHFQQKQAWLKMFLISYVFMAVGFLTKGLPSLAFQGFTLICWLIYEKQWKRLFSWAHAAGFFIGFLMISIYFILYDQRADAFAYLGRLASEASMKTGIESSLADVVLNSALFPFRIIKILLPWSLIFLLYKWKSFVLQFRSRPLIAFSSIVILANIWIYWFTGDSKDRYLYMFVPFFCILLGYTFPKTRIILYAVTALLILRIVFNFIYLPILDRSDVAQTKEQAMEIFHITKDKPLFLTGKLQHLDSKIGIGDAHIMHKRIQTAPLFTYQISYYLAKERKEIIPFVESMDKMGYYIAPLEMATHSSDSIVHDFYETWQKMDRAVLYVE